MGELISKRSTTERLIIAKTLLESVLQDMPTAEKRGEWVKEWRSANGYTRINGYKCSRCIVVYPWKTNYCPNCGAKMEG